MVEYKKNSYIYGLRDISSARNEMVYCKVNRIIILTLN